MSIRQTNAGCNVRTPGNGEELLQPCTAYYVYDAKDFLLYVSAAAAEP
jgi:hypothetical protein